MVSVLAFSLALTAADPSAIPVTTRYDDCVALVQSDLEAGRAHAQRWTQEGGGAEAQHCLAIADMAAGFNKLAGARLEEAAERKDAGDDYMRARLLNQAALAWLEAGEIVNARRALNAAFTLVPDSGELQLTAAKLHAAEGQWSEAIAAVDAARQAGFVSAEAYVLRGRAHIAVGDYRAAAEDVVNALKLDPANIDAYTLRGEIQQTGIDINVAYRKRNAGE